MPEKMNFDDGVSVYEGTPSPELVAEYALANNDYRLMRDLIERGDISLKPDEYGNSFLHHAAATANAEMIQLLVAMGGDMYAINEAGQTPYEVAMTSWNDEGFKGFLAAKLDMNSVGTSQRTLPYDVAAYANWQTIETFLMETKISPNYMDASNYTLLHEACKHGNIDSIRTLLDKGANVNVVDDVLSTPLHYLAAYNYRDTNRRLGVETLMHLGADIDAQNAQGMTPLHYAAHVGSSKVALTLIQEGANVNIPDKKGKTVLDYVDARLSMVKGDSEQYNELMVLRERLLQVGAERGVNASSTLSQVSQQVEQESATLVQQKNYSR